ncbi:MAG TPA: 30S ribosomal protein S12 methylthiotransferase RimO [Firmicutes bacterium]|nr:30S ribosomal protein S12 methylthiotransferase RimO [Bacillota bacterium]
MVSLGCAKNRIDSEVMLGILRQQGFDLTADPLEADVIIVNSCTFIESATSESIDAVLEMAQYKERGRCKALILAGCMGSRYKEQLLAELPEVDAIIGTGDVGNVAAIAQRVLSGERFATTAEPLFLYDEQMPRLLTTSPHSAYVKIAEGCNHRCAFCVIPSIRGSYRSRPLNSIVAETRRLVRNGAKEIILIAQDTTWYGRDIYGESRLADLLRRVAAVEGLHWLRLLYAYPTHLSDDVLQVVAEQPNICKYVELPLQHVSDTVLRAMYRQGDGAYINRLIDRIRQIIPDVTLRTSFIVGYPGETEADFAALCDFVTEKRFDHVGVFTYSAEEGTPAAQMPHQIPQAVKEERRQRLLAIQQRISRAKNEGCVGQVTDVLVDRVTDSVCIGRTRRQAPEIDGITYVKGRRLQVGDMVRARILSASDYDLTAVVE